MIVKIVLDLPIVNDFIDILINVLAIYVIPLVFLTQKRLHSIRLGLKCIIGNFNYSWLLVILTVISYILNNLFQEYGMTLFNGNLFITAMISSIFNFILIVVDFAVFISASLILKEKINKYSHIIYRVLSIYNQLVQVTARAEAFLYVLGNWNFIKFMKDSGNPGCP